MKNLKIFIAGHSGMVGKSLVKLIKRKKNVDIITANRKELNLLNQAQVLRFFKKNKLDQVYLVAARVGGIHANNAYPAEFIYENLMIQANVINSAFLTGVKKLLFLGSSCIYPKNIKQPIKEDQLFTGKLEETNEPYAIAKISGIKMCESYNRQYGKTHKIDYRSIMPTNLYGPGNNYHPENSHVIAGLMHRFYEAKKKKFQEVIIWGSGNAKREFLYVDDMTRACYLLMNLDKKIYDKYTSPMLSHINIGSGNEISIKKLANLMKEIVNYKGKIIFDKNKPDGTLRKKVDTTILNKIGFKAKVKLKTGLIRTYKDHQKFRENN